MGIFVREATAGLGAYALSPKDETTWACRYVAIRVAVIADLLHRRQLCYFEPRDAG